MSCSHSLLQRHEFVTKPLLLSPVSCTTPSDGARGWTDGTGGATRSSTQESLHCDSSSRTLSFSLSASVGGVPLQALSCVNAPPPLSAFPVGNRVAAGASADSASACSDDGGEILLMDIFDVALAQDIQQRRVQEHRRHHTNKTDARKWKSTRDAAAGSVRAPTTAAKSTLCASSMAFPRTPEASLLPDGPQQLPMHLSSREDSTASATHRLASATYTHPMRVRLRHQKGQRTSPAFALSFLPSASGDLHLRSADDGLSSFEASFSTRNEKIRYLHRLLHETRTLHEALWKQICELHEVEEQEKRRKAQRALSQRR